MAYSSSSTMPSAASSSISMSSAAASSSRSRPPADAALAPGLDYDTAFPVLGSSPSRPRGRSAARPPRLLRRSEDRPRGGKTAATAVASHAAAGTTTTSAAPPTSDVPATTSKAGEISARPPTCAAPGSFAAAAAVLSGAPALLPAAQAFGGYSFGYTMGDLFQDLGLQPQVEPARLRQHPQVINEPRHPPPLRFQLQPPLRPQMLQAPRYFNAPMAQVQLQRPPPQFAPPRFGGQQYQAPARPLHQRVRPTQLAAPHQRPMPFQFEHQQGSFAGFVSLQGARTAAARQGTGQPRMSCNTWMST